jgi:hypothetical protein
MIGLAAEYRRDAAPEELEAACKCDAALGPELEYKWDAALGLEAEYTRDGVLGLESEAEYTRDGVLGLESEAEYTRDGVLAREWVAAWKWWLFSFERTLGSPSKSRIRSLPSIVSS